MSRSLFTQTAVLVALAASLAGCGGSGGYGSDAGTTASTTTTTTAPAPTVTTVAIQVVDGKPQGGIVRQSVDHDASVAIVVSSDTADEVHVHGYDLAKDVEAGGTVRIPFEATIRGRFEVELENSGVQLAELTVK